MSRHRQIDNGTVMYKCRLPIPFVKGNPVDYQRMSLEQLKRFVPFIYQCLYNKELPTHESRNAGVCKPSWWNDTVSFDIILNVTPTSQKGVHNPQQKELSTLVRNCYEHYEVSSLLSLGRELSNKSSYKLVKDRPRNWEVQDNDGRTLVMIDMSTRTYDSFLSNNRFVENEHQENISSANANIRLTRNQKTNCTERKTSKRKLFETDEIEKKVHQCKHCTKDFTHEDFRDEHESQCIKGPFSQSQGSKMDFMNALGMFGSSQQITKSSTSEPYPPVGTSSRPRSLRKLPKRNQLLSIFKNNPVPISSKRGQRFIEEIGDKQEHSYPPDFEKQCTPKSGLPFVDDEFPNVTKRIILKDGENPHKYSLGRRQRTDRYQELVVGLNKSCWPLLNSCKSLKVFVDKLPPSMKTLRIPSTKKSYLEQKWKPALSLPCVRLVDYKKVKMTDKIGQYMRRDCESPKPGTSKSSAC